MCELRLLAATTSLRLTWNELRQTLRRTLRRSLREAVCVCGRPIGKTCVADDKIHVGFTRL
jgi:hypothetical protein